MNNSAKSITNNIANITTINNQTAIIVASTFSSAENSITSLGGAIGTIQTTEDLNNLLNEATNHSYQNMQLQTPYFQGLEQAQSTKIQPICSIPQPAQNIPAQPMPERHAPKQAYTKPHSTTRIASESQQNLIQKLCKEKGKDLDTILAPLDKDLSAITSAEANQIIQVMKSNK